MYILPLFYTSSKMYHACLLYNVLFMYVEPFIYMPKCRVLYLCIY